jgi:hypothetical protein
MRMRSVAVVVSALLVLGLLAPTGAWAKRVTAGGSILLAGSSLSEPFNQVVVTLITANPGLEKTIVQQLPLPGGLFSAPFFVSEEQGNPGPNDIGTTMILTNATDGPLTFTLTLFSLNGATVISTPLPVLNSRETRVIPLGSLLP